MHRQSISRFVALALILVCVGCTAGPSPLRRRADDYWNYKYEQRPIETTVLSTVVPYYPFITLGASFFDVLVVNPVQFWSHDLWAGEGAGFVHDQPTEANEGIWPWLRQDDDER